MRGLPWCQASGLLFTANASLLSSWWVRIGKPSPCCNMFSQWLNMIRVLQSSLSWLWKRSHLLREAFAQGEIGKSCYISLPCSAVLECRAWIDPVVDVMSRPKPLQLLVSWMLFTLKPLQLLVSWKLFPLSETLHSMVLTENLFWMNICKDSIIFHCPNESRLPTRWWAHGLYIPPVCVLYCFLWSHDCMFYQAIVLFYLLHILQSANTSDVVLPMAEA